MQLDHNRLTAADPSHCNMKEKRWRMGPFGSQRLCLDTRNGVMYHGYPLMDIPGMAPSMVEEFSIRSRSVHAKTLILWVMCLILDGRERDGFLVGPRWIQCNQRISLNYHECLSMVTCWDCRYIIYVMSQYVFSYLNVYVVYMYFN